MKKIKAISLFLALVICFSSISIIDIKAQTPDISSSRTNIKLHNLSLDDVINIVYKVESTNVPSGSTEGLLVWRAPRSSYTINDNPDYNITRYLIEDGTNYKVFFFDGASAKQMTDDFYAVSYVTDGEGNYKYSKVDKYSILQYCLNKKDSDTRVNDGTKTLGELVNSILEYGATSQLYFNYKTDRLATDDYVEISLAHDHGTEMFADGTSKGLFKPGEVITISSRYALTEEYDDVFDVWYDTHGRVYGGGSVEVTVGDCDETFTSYCLYSDQHIYELSNNGDYYSVAKGYEDGSGCGILIPSVYDGLPVLSIANYAINNRNSEVIYIKDGVVEIGSSAFWNCYTTGIRVPNTVTSIGSYAFSYSTIKSIILPNRITTIEMNTFYGCLDLEEVVLPNSLEAIGQDAFYNCDKLTKINLPDSLTSIDDQAFMFCTSITNISLPSSITNLGSYVFYGCSNLTEITYRGTVDQWKSISKGSFGIHLTVHCTDGDIQV